MPDARAHVYYSFFLKLLPHSVFKILMGVVHTTQVWRWIGKIP